MTKNKLIRWMHLWTIANQGQPVKLTTLHREMTNRGFKVAQRTTRRDINQMEELGFITVGFSDGMIQATLQWGTGPSAAKGGDHLDAAGGALTETEDADKETPTENQNDRRGPLER